MGVVTGGGMLPRLACKLQGLGVMVVSLPSLSNKSFAERILHHLILIGSSTFLPRVPYNVYTALSSNQMNNMKEMYISTYFLRKFSFSSKGSL